MKDYWIKLGEFGRHQWLFIMSYVAFYIMQACETFSPTFIAILPKFYCEDWLPTAAAAENKSRQSYFLNNSILGQCHNGNGSACPKNKWRFDDKLRTETLYSEFELICSQSYLVPLGTSIYMAGLLLGSFWMGYFSDKYGRFPCTLVCLFMTTLAAVALPFLPSYWLFVLTRFILALFMSGTWVIMASYQVELTTPNKRLRFNAISGLFGWNFGALLSAIIAYFIRGYKSLLIAYGSLAVLNIFPLFFYWESPLWLISVGRRKEAIEVTGKIAKRNGKTLTEAEVIELVDMVEQKSLHDKTTNESIKNANLGFWTLLHFPRQRIVLFINWIHFISSSMIYYAISLGASSLGGNLYLNYCLMFGGDSLMNIPLYIWGKIIPRRSMLMFLYSLGSILCFISSALFYLAPRDTTGGFISIALIVTSLFGRLMLSKAFFFNWVYAPEVFPTVVRASAVGSCSAMSRIGGILAPFIIMLQSIWAPLPFLIFGAVSGICALICLYLPETRGRQCLQTLEDGEAWLISSSNNGSLDLVTSAPKSFTSIVNNKKY